MAVAEQFSLRWNNFHSNLSTGFHNLLQSEQLVDVTLVAEGKLIKAHQVVLSVCSPFFQKIFQTNPCPHPIVILTIGYQELKDILIFIYQGEVKVKKEELSGFLKAAEFLQIKGLSGDNKDETPESDMLENQTIPKLSNDDFTDFQNVPETNNETERFSLAPKSSSPTPNFLSARRKKNNTSLKRPASPIRENYLSKTQPTSANKPEFRGKTPPIKSRCKSNSPKDDKLSTESPSNFDANENASDSLHIKIEPEIDDYINSSAVSQDAISASENGRSSNKKASYQCETCNKTFTRRDHLKTHHKNIHGEDQGPFTCYICSQLYKNSESLRKHMSKFHVIKVEVLPSIGEMCV